MATSVYSNFMTHGWGRTSMHHTLSMWSSIHKVVYSQSWHNWAQKSRGENCEQLCKLLSIVCWCWNHPLYKHFNKAKHADSPIAYIWKVFFNFHSFMSSFNLIFLSVKPGQIHNTTWFREAHPPIAQFRLVAATFSLHISRWRDWRLCQQVSLIMRPFMSAESGLLFPEHWRMTIFISFTSHYLT